jgi:hemoglobin
MNNSLFDRLGGEEGITKIVDSAVEAHMNNPAISARFLPYLQQPDKLKIIRQHSIEFFCAGSGGNHQYHGKDMSSAHTGMNINHGEYMQVVDDIIKTLEKFEIDEASQKDVLYILWSLKDQIIAK